MILATKAIPVRLTQESTNGQALAKSQFADRDVVGDTTFHHETGVGRLVNMSLFRGIGFTSPKQINLLEIIYVTPIVG